TEIWRNESAAWPVANPVITCASASDSGFPSNFVADPFLYVQGNPQICEYIDFVFARYVGAIEKSAEREES
ncbi:hypothetical protein Gorai_013066, partial [Gossypium raimondii]|nr:hypothetical protein [Gossypium raimondii]